MEGTFPHKVTSETKKNRHPVVEVTRKRTPDRLLHSQAKSLPPRDLEFVDGTLAVVMVDQMFVTHPDALVVHGDAPAREVRHDAVEEIVDIRYRFPGSERHVHFAVVFKEFGLTLAPLEAQVVVQWALVWCDGHFFLEDADLQLGKPGLSLHGPQFRDLNDPLQVICGAKRGDL